MDDMILEYKYATIGDIWEGVLACEEPKLIAVKDGEFADELKCTDNLMNVINERLPKKAR